MSSINFNLLFSTVTSEFQTRKLQNTEPTKFNLSVLQISDQQSRDKNYEKSLEWIRTYIASLQAKLNAIMEELNTLYETMLTETLYRKADTKDTAKLVNSMENADFDPCIPSKDFTPYAKYVRNYQYNPFYGSRALDLSNYYHMGENKDVSVARGFYDALNGTADHHELGASAFGTLGYLWMWDVDRINATYASTMEQQIEPDGTVKQLSIIGGSNPKQYQVNITALQPNRGVFAPGTEDDPDTVYYALKEGFENDGVINSVNNAVEDCKWTQSYKNPWDRDKNIMSDHLQWRVANNRGQTGGSIHFGDPTHTNYNYEYYIVKDNAENPALPDIPSNHQPLPANLSGGDNITDVRVGGIIPDLGAFNLGSKNFVSNQFTEWHNKDERDGSDTLSAKWRTVADTFLDNDTPGVGNSLGSFTGAGYLETTQTKANTNHSYWFGNSDGDYGTAQLDAVARNTTVKMAWSGQGSYGFFFTDFVWHEPNFDLRVFGPSGQMTTSNPGYANSNSENHTLTGQSGKRYVYVTLESHHGLWSTIWQDYSFNLKMDQDKLETAPAFYNKNRTTLTTDIVNGSMGFGLNTTIFGWFDVIDPHDNWWGKGHNPRQPGDTPQQDGSIGSFGSEGGYGSMENSQSHPYITGFKIDHYIPYNPKGDLTRKLDLLDLTGDDGDGLGFERLELRYRQNFLTEKIDGDNDGVKYDRRYVQENVANSAFTNLTNYNSAKLAGNAPNSITVGQDDKRANTNNEWEQRFFALSESWGTTDQKINFHFEANDQWQNETRGWNVDDIEVVARGESRGDLISPKMDLSKYVTASLQYDSRLGTKTRLAENDKEAGDTIEAFYQVDGGAWLPIPQTLYQGAEKADNGGAEDNANQYSGASEGSQGFVNHVRNLDCAAGHSDVRIKYVFKANFDNNEGDGWNLDNVHVFGRKSAPTDFYTYRENIDSAFVSNGHMTTLTANAGLNATSLNVADATNFNVNDFITLNNQKVRINNKVGNTLFLSSGLTIATNSGVTVLALKEANNQNRPNISFDPGRTNYLGKFSNEGSRVEITNTDTPMFANTILTYVEQDAIVYNKAKTLGAGVWRGSDLGPALVVDKTGLVKVSYNTNFNQDIIGRLTNGDGEMYVDDALAINLGLVQDKEPTLNTVGAKDTGWVNFDSTASPLKYIAGTCFDETNGTYEYMTTFIKKTAFLTAAQASSSKSITLNVDKDAYLYVNGKQISGVRSGSGQTYTIPAADLVTGFNTIAFQHNEVQGANTFSIGGDFGAFDETWAVKISNSGYKGNDNAGVSYPIGADPDGPPPNPIDPARREVEMREVFSQDRDGKRALSLNFSNLDKDGAGVLSSIKSIDLVATGEPTIQSYVTAKYTSTTVTDDGSLTTILNNGYINNVKMLGDSAASFTLGPTKNLNYQTNLDGKAEVSVIIDNHAALVNDSTMLMKVQYYEDTDQDGVIDIDTNRDGLLSTAEETAGASKLKTKYIGAQDLRDTSQTAIAGVKNRFKVSSGSSSLIDSDENANDAFNVYDNLLNASKGRSGGADVTGNKNVLTARLKQLVDSDEFQEVMKFNLVDNIFLAATVTDNRGDQIVGKLILDWDFRRRRIGIKQGAFSAVYKS